MLYQWQSAIEAKLTVWKHSFRLRGQFYVFIGKIVSFLQAFTQWERERIVLQLRSFGLTDVDSNFFDRMYTEKQYAANFLTMSV